MNQFIKTVLIIDDEVSIRQSFVDFFEDHLWCVLQAESAEEALTILEEKSPGCAVVDIRLKGIDGDAFIREACEKKPKMAFVVCTGSPEYDLPEDLSKLPNVCGQIFRKPVSNMAEIESKLFQLIRNE
jgi:FixJ family two-component response regulator